MIHKLEEAIDHGRAKAQCNLGAMYADGQGVAQDYSAAIKWFRMSAHQGYALAQYNLGIMHDNGEGFA